MIRAKLLHRVGDLRVAAPRSYKKGIKLGSKVYIESQQIGRVIDVIGPVKRPYLVIKPHRPYPVDDVYGIEVRVL